MDIRYLHAAHKLTDDDIWQLKLYILLRPTDAMNVENLVRISLLSSKQ